MRQRRLSFPLLRLPSCCTRTAGTLQEPPTVAQGGGKPPSDWPSGGTIDYRDVTAIYRPGLPPVLKDLSFTIQVCV